MVRAHRVEIDLRGDHQLALAGGRHQRAAQRLDRIARVAVEEVLGERLGHPLRGNPRLRIELGAARQQKVLDGLGQRHAIGRF